MAACLAAGAGAVVSDGTAARLWRIDRRTSPVTVTVPPHRHPEIGGVHVRRRSLSPDETTVHRGVPVTTPVRTLLDLAAIRSADRLERIVAEARALRLVTPGHLAALVDECQGRRGAATLRALLQGRTPMRTRSEAERRSLALFRRGGLPAPEVNVRLAGYEVDFLWREPGLVVEVDGYAFHSSRRAFESDRRRDAELGAAGFVVVRITWRQLVDEPERLLVRLATRLATLGRQVVSK